MTKLREKLNEANLKRQHAEDECGNLRKAYEEVNARHEQATKHFQQQIADLTRLLKNANESNQHLSQENGRIRRTAAQFVRDHDRDGETIAKLTDLLHWAIDANKKLVEQVKTS